MQNEQNELDRLRSGPRPDERPAGAGLVEITIRSRQPITEVVQRARDVLAAVIESGPDPLRDAPARLPGWFVDRCAPEPSPEERQRWLAGWRTLDREQKVAAERERGWTLAQWLGWMEPAERTWWWWDATTLTQSEATVSVQVDGWPTAWGSLEWLLRAAGADMVEEGDLIAVAPLLVDRIFVQYGPIMTLGGTGWALSISCPWTATIDGIFVDSETEPDEAVLEPLKGQEFLGFEDSVGEEKATVFHLSRTTITAVPDDPAWEPYVLHLPTGIFTGPVP